MFLFLGGWVTTKNPQNMANEIACFNIEKLVSQFLRVTYRGVRSPTRCPTYLCTPVGCQRLGRQLPACLPSDLAPSTMAKHSWAEQPFPTPTASGQTLSGPQVSPPAVVPIDTTSAPPRRKVPAVNPPGGAEQPVPGQSLLKGPGQ